MVILNLVCMLLGLADLLAELSGLKDSSVTTEPINITTED